LFFIGEGIAVTDGTLMRAMLFDFYGELLTDKQREYFDLHYNEDLSLSEIADEAGISRQGVWDIIRRAEDAMADMEEKTGLIRRFTEQAEIVAEIEDELSALRESSDETAAQVIDDVIGKLEGLKG
jgi:uncharacterized protein